ncbi:MAG: UDP-N-acetylmuramyl pentapeptide phosphotransferase/UDP-N-acetylglucosamine-1-phosphate transferase [Planctomycetota bacterium]|jgi:UDP-N-acetylmuramyl pentapeptide phosphotransferase/UDP-N-acetylglucosamine-1-phosphate transferase
MESAFMFALVLLLTGVLARLALIQGLGDAPSGNTKGRKPQRTPVPFVGGTALLAALVVAAVTFGDAQLIDPLGWFGVAGEAPGLGRSLLWASLLGAFGVGLLDDLLPEGLAPLPKVCGQLLASVPFAFLCAQSFGPGVAQWSGLPGVGAAIAAALVASFLVLVAMNVVNTFDNFDGALAGVGAVGFLMAAPALAAGLAGFLPWNLNAEPLGSKQQRDAGACPSSYLGDSGSHLLGFLALIHPLAWGLLLVPTLDISRLSLLRWRTGSAPWVGDSRHLAQDLGRRGWSRRQVALVLALAALPASLGVWFAQPDRVEDTQAGVLATISWGPGIAGVGVSLLIVMALWRLPEPRV